MNVLISTQKRRNIVGYVTVALRQQWLSEREKEKGEEAIQWLRKIS